MKLSKIALLSMSLLLITGCGEKVETKKENNIVSESEDQQIEEQNGTSKENNSAPLIMTTDDGYKVYYLSQMTKEEFPNLIGTFKMSGYDYVDIQLIPYHSTFKLETDSKCNINDSDYSYIDKLVIDGIEITKNDLTVDGIISMIYKLNSKIPLQGLTFGDYGGLADSIIDDDLEGSINNSLEFFEDKLPKEVEEGKYWRYSEVYLHDDPYNNKINIKFEWTETGKLDNIECEFKIEYDIPGEQNIDRHTVYTTIDNEKIAVLLDKPSIYDEYTGYIYIQN